MAKVLITGGSGYVGTAAAVEMRQRGYEVLIADKRPSPLAPKWGYEYVNCRVDCHKPVRQLLDKHNPDVVVHAAALTYPGASRRRPLEYWRHNVNATQVLLASMEHFGMEKLVFISSSSVYGSGHDLHGDRVGPVTPYGTTKLAGETLVQDWADTLDDVASPSTWRKRAAYVLRLCNVGGADPNGEFGEDHARSYRMIPMAMKRITGMLDALTVYGEPAGQQRQFVHVCDAARAIGAATSLLLQGGQQGVKTCNVVGTETMCMDNLVNLVSLVSGHEVPRTIAATRTGDPACVAMRPDADRVLSFQPRLSIQAIVETAWDWHAAHKEWNVVRTPKRQELAEA